jgi:hypothetical protein
MSLISPINLPIWDQYSLIFTSTLKKKKLMLAQVRETYLADNYEYEYGELKVSYCREDMPIYSTLPNFNTLLVHYSLTYCQWLRCKS